MLDARLWDGEVLVSTLCEKCQTSPEGEHGHASLAFYVGGPYPGHHIFNCKQCGERWIRHAGMDTRYGWTRYALQFAGSIRKPRLAPPVD
jgi:hypothetical protein